MSADIFDATDADFQQKVIENDKVTVVDFWAPWCGPCKQLTPILEAVAAEFAGQVSVAKVNVDQNQSIAGQFGIQGLPTLVAIKNGEVVGRSVGFANRSQVSSFIRTAIG